MRPAVWEQFQIIWSQTDKSYSVALAHTSSDAGFHLATNDFARVEQGARGEPLAMFRFHKSAAAAAV